jgi:hypothetical protein
MQSSTAAVGNFELPVLTPLFFWPVVRRFGVNCHCGKRRVFCVFFFFCWCRPCCCRVCSLHAGSSRLGGFGRPALVRQPHLRERQGNWPGRGCGLANGPDATDIQGHMRHAQGEEQEVPPHAQCQRQDAGSSAFVSVCCGLAPRLPRSRVREVRSAMQQLSLPLSFATPVCASLRWTTLRQHASIGWSRA